MAHDGRALILSCEHGGNRVPASCRALFRKAGGVLKTHRGLDRGAARLARRIARSFRVPLHLGQVTRLVVDLNRSAGNRSLFSTYTARLGPEEQRDILDRYYQPYRTGVERAIAGAIRKKGSVLHLSIHSFTPVLKSRVRKADIGILYDPSRRAEKSFAILWQKTLLELDPRLRVRRNYPYRGIDDGFIPHLRRLFPSRYVGLELEVNQGSVANPGPRAASLTALIVESLRRLPAV